MNYELWFFISLILNSKFLILKTLIRFGAKNIFRWLVTIIYLLAAKTALAIETGLGATADAATLNKGNIPDFIGTVIKTLLGFTGIVFFILMVYGGLIWMNAKGNEKEVEKAKNILTQSIIGIIIIAAAYAITSEIIRILSK